MAWSDLFKSRTKPAQAVIAKPVAAVLQADDAARANVLVDEGNLLEDAGDLQAALARYEAAIQVAPSFARGHLNCGNILLARQDVGGAIAAYRAAIARNPAHAGAHFNLGNAQMAARRLNEAIESYQCALAIDPRFAAAWIAIGNACADGGDKSAAEGHYRRALTFNPDDIDVLGNLGLLLFTAKRYVEAADVYARVLKLAPMQPYALGHLLSARIYACDWTQYAELVEGIHRGVAAGERVITPFECVPVARDAQTLLHSAQIYAHERFARFNRRLWLGERYLHSRIRIGYLSADLHSHATAALMIALFEQHRRDLFEVYAFSFGPDDGTPMRKRMCAAFEHFLDVRELSDVAIAEQVRALEIDVLIDLKGFTAQARPAVLALRPAPVQVNYLGFPGSMGADFVDYLIADERIIPTGQESGYTEKIVRLPGSYQVNDSARRVSDRAPSRTELGLPPTGFVYCCFNNSYKITPPMFDLWMRLLARVDGSVLWLLDDNAAASQNLREQARARGIDPQRLIFAARADLPEHLARQQFADLFLDTVPCNAHTTASDALWVGLPVLTCAGETFPGRVAVSLLHAVGLQALVADDLPHYEAMAYELATQPARHQTLVAALSENRAQLPLFNTMKTRDYLESAYAQMYQRSAAGEAAAGFDVATQ